MTPDEIITTLLDLGFSPAGETTAQVVRIPPTRAPVYGGAGARSAHAVAEHATPSQTQISVLPSARALPTSN